MAKSMKLGGGGRAQKLNKQLEQKSPAMGKYERGAIIGSIARKKGAAPGQKNFHR
jgi:hypothetical protein